MREEISLIGAQAPPILFEYAITFQKSASHLKGGLYHAVSSHTESQSCGCDNYSTFKATFLMHIWQQTERVQLSEDK